MSSTRSRSSPDSSIRRIRSHPASSRAPGTPRNSRRGSSAGEVYMTRWLGWPPEPSCSRSGIGESMATQATARPPFARRSRGLTTVTSAILIVVVLALVGVGTYAVMGGFSKPTPLTCQPLSAPACARFQNLHDVTLELPFKSIQEGNAVPFTVSLPSGESATSYNLNFGDGSPVVSSHSTSVEHAYSG